CRRSTFPSALSIRYSALSPQHSALVTQQYLSFLQLREDIRREAGFTDLFGELLDSGKAEIGHLLLADFQELGHVLVGPALDHQELQDLEARIVSLVAPVADQFSQTFGDGAAFELPPLLAAGEAGSCGLLIGLLVKKLG